MKKNIFLVGLLLLALSLMPAFALAADATPTPSPSPSPDPLDDSVKKLQEQQAAIADKRAEISDLQKKIDALKGKRDNVAADAELIASQVKKLADQLDKAELELKQTQTSIQVTNKRQTQTVNDIDSLSKDVAEKKDKLSGLLRVLYEREQESFVRVFFDTWSLSDMLNERAAYKELQDRTITLVDDMKKQISELEDKQQQLEDQQRSLSALANTLNAQQDEIAASKQAQQKFLNAKRDEQIAYEQKIAEVEAAKEEIKKQVFTLQSGGVQLSLNNAFDMARFAGKLTGVRPALLLAVLKVESNLGGNVGSGHYPDDMQPQSRDAFVRITKQLGIDPFTTPVSRKPRSGYGWGGAMGPAQIMPATWEAISPRLATLLHKPVPNPYELTDAFVATAVFLADRGAADPAQEYVAVNKYIAGPNWQYNTWYGDRVLAVAAEYAKQGL